MRIGIDCEFSFDADNEFFLVCAAVTQEDGTTHMWWYDKIGELKAYILEHKADTWVAHNVETAEGYMFLCLGLRPTRFRWHDTLMMSRVVHNQCAERHLKHSLVDCLAREHIKKLDVDKKHEDQNMCVWKQDCTWEEHLFMLESNKEHLMAYCLSDTAYLLQLDSALDKGMQKRTANVLDKATPLEANRRSHYFGFIAALASEISWNGIPLDRERVRHLLANAPATMANAQMEFARKYPGSFREGKKMTKNVAVCREYAAKAYGKNPPRTNSGAVSLASENTKKHKGMCDFLDDYYHLDKECRALASFSKKDREKNWLGMYLPKRGIVRPRINPLGTQTGRCGSKPSTGFVYTMSKPFRGLIDPPEGYVIVELDYHSEEIGCQAYLSGDKTMAEMYEGPDYYMSISYRLEPSLKNEELKVQKAKRKKYKVIALMSNYGCGAAHLAEIAGIPEKEARGTLKDLKSLFKTYWRYVEKCLDKCGEGSSISFSDGFRIKNSGGKITSLGNWPFQGVGALILRKILVKLYQANVRVVAPIHDAIAFMCKESELQAVTETVAQIMRDASKECLGTVVDVGEPEVTFHDIPNCHSELSSREDYAKVPDILGKDQKEYYAEFQKMMEGVNTDVEGDSENLYVDETF